MNIVVDINHPAHVHFFRNFARGAEKLGHKVMITASDKDVALSLLDYYGFRHTLLGSYGKGLLNKIINLPIIDYRMWRAVKDFKPDVMTGIASARAAHAAALTKGCKAYIFDDTEHAVMQIALYMPFAHKVCVPDCFTGPRKKKHLPYAGYHELAYLHPEVFTPDPEVVKECGLSPDEKYFIARFVGWDATHDIGHKGFSLEGKIRLVRELEKYGRVVITSEKALPPEVEKHRMNFHPAKMHHVMAFASMYVGEGATMASEAAVLGVPSIYVNSLNMGYIKDEEKRGLLYNLPEEEAALSKAVELAESGSVKEEFRKKRELLLKDKINVTKWMLETILK